METENFGGIEVGKAENQDIAVKTEKIVSNILVKIKKVYNYCTSQRWVKCANLLSAELVTVLLFYKLFKTNEQSMILMIAVTALWLPLILPYAKQNRRNFYGILISIAVCSVSFLIGYVHWIDWFVAEENWRKDIVLAFSSVMFVFSFSYFANSIFRIMGKEIKKENLSRWKQVAEVTIKLAAVLSALSAMFSMLISFFSK